MKLKFIGLDYDYFNLEGQDYVKITGRSSERKSVCLVDKVDNFFYVLSKKPATVITSIKINLSRPRKISDQTSEKFVEIEKKLMDLL